MRKWLNVILIAALMFITGKAFAQTVVDTDYGYVIVKCTVTIDVDVLDDNATAWFVARNNYNGLAPNTEYVSVTSITVQNKSIGAVLKYAVMVSSIQRNSQIDGTGNWISDDNDEGSMIKGWTLSTSNSGICNFVLGAVFAKDRPSTTDFSSSEANDIFLVNLAGGNPSQSNRQAYTYKVNGQNFDPANSLLRYSSALGNTSGTNAISPIVNENNPRGLWFYVKTPEAVTDEYPRRIIIRVDGGLGSAW